MPNQRESADGSGSTECVHAAIRNFFSVIPAPVTPFPVVLAVSGGPDSLCMADAIVSLQSEIHVRPVLAHLNHGLRGQDAKDDVLFVQSFAETHHVGFYTADIDVWKMHLDRRLSVEEAARIARYSFLASVAHQTKASHIAVAHNADDQVETVLLRLIRGTGIAGLQGMKAISPLKSEYETDDATLQILRPLLSMPRQMIVQYCSEQNLAPRYDSTNDERHHMRNRIRLDLLPLLEQFNPGVRKVIGRLAETAASDMEIINYTTKLTLETIGVNDGNSSVFDRSAWCKLPVGLQRSTLREGLLQFNGVLTHVKYAGIEEAREVLNGTAVHAEIAILSNVRIVVSKQRFWFKLA